MNKIINERKLEAESNLRNLIVDKVLIEEQIDKLSKNVIDINNRIISIRAMLMELIYLGDKVDIE